MAEATDALAIVASQVKLTRKVGCVNMGKVSLSKRWWVGFLEKTHNKNSGLEHTTSVPPEGGADGSQQVGSSTTV